MMKYDFKSIPDRRGCGSNKWDACKNASTENVPLSVADMEFPTAPEIVKAIKKLADTTILGYTSPTEEYYNAVISWMKRRHNYEVQKEWIFNTPGVVNALGILIEAATKPGDGIILLTPVYYPFDLAVIAKTRHIVYSKLKVNDGRYEIDFDDLKEKAERKDVTAILFCNPHNPVGRVWTKEELIKVSDICCDNGVFVIDDEIHHDIIMPGYEQTVMATVTERIADNIAVCTAPSKSFNLAGLQCSNIIIKNEKVRVKANACGYLNLQMGLNIFAYESCITAYNKCEKWLEEMISVVYSNSKLVESFMAENYPEIIVYPLEGTYLQWLDVSGLGLTHVEMKKLLEGAGIYLDNGELFGLAGRGYQRINLACSEETIKAMLARFKKAMDEIREKWAKEGAPYHKTLIVGEKVEGFVYSSADRYKTDLKQSIKKPTLIIFSRYYDCEICRVLIESYKAAYPLFKMAGIDIKFVLQSSLTRLSGVAHKYPFELIADPKAVLYDRYNVFEADSIGGMIAGDKLLEFAMGKDVKKLLNIDMFSGMIASAFDSEEEIEGEVKPRGNQVSAFIGVDTDMEVSYSYYGKTMLDFPNPKDIIKAMKR